MNEKFNITVLVVPLDWGLGHATRCIPIIHHLLYLGCNVIIGAEKAQQKLLHEAFPNVKILPLKGYRITYTRRKAWFSFHILFQLPKIIQSIRTEHKWLQQVVHDFDVEAVISDNRYGLYHTTIPSVFITHQLRIKAPFTWMERWIQTINYRYINRFAACWIPDEKQLPGLAGTLSHPNRLPAVPVKYFGGLSRFEPANAVRQLYDVLILISGPEPQRSVLENILIRQLENFNGRALLVRGLPYGNQVLPGFKQVTIVNHLPAVELSAAFQQSKFIISRSGYTTVMDIIKLQKRSVLIPTPGQTEQGYLAQHLQNQGWCLNIQQHNFNLKQALQQAEKFDYKLPAVNMEQYKNVVDDFIASLKPKPV